MDRVRSTTRDGAVISRVVETLTAAGRRPMHGPLRWAFALLAAALVALASAPLQAWTGYQTPFQPFYLALVVVACYAGLGPGLLALGVSALFVAGFGIGGPNEPSLDPGARRHAAVLYVIIGSLVVGVCHQLGSARSRVRDAERLLRELVDRAPGLVFVLDGDGRVRFASRALARISGRSVEEIVGQPAIQVIPELAAAVLQPASPDAEPTPRTYTLDSRGQKVVLAGHPVQFVLDGETLTGGFYTDITADVAARRALEEADGRLQMAQDDVGVGWWDLDLRTRSMVASPSSWRLHGLEPTTRPAALEEWVEAFHPDDRAAALARLDEAVSAGVQRYRHTFRTRWADGTVRWLESHLRIDRDADGAAYRLVGAAIDVTDARSAREAATASAARLRLITDTLPVLIAYVDREHRYQFASGLYQQWYGRDVSTVT